MREVRALSARIDAFLKTQTQTQPLRLKPYTTQEVADLIGRSREWVIDECRGGRIKSLPGKPYRIPVDEMGRLLTPKTTPKK